MNLTISSYLYDTTQALFDGSVDVKGADALTMTTARTLPEIFERFVRDDQVDVSEFGLTFLLRAREAGEDYVALPIFPNRVFRHSCVFVSTAGGITHPEQLVDRTIGEFGIYGQDSGVWAKGILMDEYGFRPERNRWVIGGLDHAAPPFGFTTHPHPQDVEITTAEAGQTLGTCWPRAGSTRSSQRTSRRPSWTAIPAYGGCSPTTSRWNATGTAVRKSSQ